jgi:hypothetical protein
MELGLIKNFVQTVDPNSAGFMNLNNMFRRKSDDKIKGGVFWTSDKGVKTGRKL